MPAGARPGRAASDTSSHTTAPTMAKIAGMRWQSAVRREQHGGERPVAAGLQPRPTTPRNSTAKVSEIEKANSPARVEAMLPP